MKQYKVIGVMSGTSLDGVDLAYCIFNFENDKWNYTIEHAVTIPYDEKWITRLTQLHKQPAFVYPKTDAFYGKYLGLLIKDFITLHKLQVDFISSHGHTIFHQPENGFTAQIGNGANIYAETGIKVINDFRVVDVALGGNGAPLVPVGDELLFGNYEACLNLGGFSNISFNKDGKRIAFDISPCNIVMNKIALEFDAPYDVDGKIARSGSIDKALLEKLNNIEYYKRTGAKSLGSEWVEENFWPLIDEPVDAADLMATVNFHFAWQIANVIKQHNIKTLFTTGGGSFNKQLIENISSSTDVHPTLPNSRIINYKEALIFAFLGVLHAENQHNTLSSVTGASKNSTGGSSWG